MIHVQCIPHRQHANDGEDGGRDECGAVAKIQHADCEGAEDDGEVQPREEGALVGEEYLGFDARGERNAFSWVGDGLVVATREGVRDGIVGGRWRNVHGLGSVARIGLVLSGGNARGKSGGLTRRRLEERLAGHLG